MMIRIDDHDDKDDGDDDDDHYCATSDYVVVESDTCRHHLVVGHSVVYLQLGSSEGSNKT